MIDWYSGLVGYDGSGLKPNRVCELTPEGEIKWMKEQFIQARGSYESSMQIRPEPCTLEMQKAASAMGLLANPTVIRLSGNPSKFLQGQNVFGPGVASLQPVVTAVVRSLPEEIRPRDSGSPLYPSQQRSRVDITTAVDLGTHKIVHEWIRTAERSTRSRHGRALVSGSTVYWGKSSRRWSMKAYCKFCELQAHPVGNDQLQADLLDYLPGKLRIELCLRGPELKIRGTLHEELIWEFMQRIEVGVMKPNANPESPNLTHLAQYTLARWIAGEDVRSALSRATFYRHRLAILKELGLDISLTYEKKTAERECFDLAYLKAHEIKIPPVWFQAKFDKHLFKPESSPEWPANPQGMEEQPA